MFKSPDLEYSYISLYNINVVSMEDSILTSRISVSVFLLK